MESTPWPTGLSIWQRCPSHSFNSIGATLIPIGRDQLARGGNVRAPLAQARPFDEYGCGSGNVSARSADSARGRQGLRGEHICFAVVKPDTCFSQHSWHHRRRVDRRRSATISNHGTDNCGRAQLRLKSLVDTGPRLARCRMGESRNRWCIGNHQLERAGMGAEQTCIMFANKMHLGGR